MSKGSNRRPGDNDAFDEGYGKIFGNKKPVRGSFVWDPVSHSMVPKDEYYEMTHPTSPMVMGDIQPYQSMVTGEMITSRSVHREHLRRHQLIEVGNEVNHLKDSRRRPEPPKGLKERIAQIANDKLR